MEPDFIDVSVALGCGVYLLLHRGTVVYVGQSKLLLRRMYKHDLSQGTLRRVYGRWAQARFRFDEVWIKPCSVDELDTVEAALITKYNPKHNIQRPSGAPMPENIRQLIQSAPPRSLPFAINRRGF